MGKTAFIFPGQGAQVVGMGKDVYENSDTAREFFDSASEAVGLDLKALCFEENDDINITEFTQVCLLTTSVSMLKEIEKRGGHCDAAGGLSLGEYCALVANGAMDGIDAARIVRKRGIYMQEEVPAGEGGMAAVMGMEASDIEAHLEKYDKVQIANYNCPGQIVISGETEQVKAAAESLKDAGAKKTVLLNVSGPFHSKLLAGAGDKLGAELENISISPMRFPYVSNVTGGYVSDESTVKDLLIRQLSNPVRWQQCVETMVADGVDTFYEIGPGRALASFNKKIGKALGVELTTYQIATMADIEEHF
ncbi:MAG: ACP S-malonyltransferase [Eubacterium sp.]|nr:ACP S-malonyltransferase [Eubacterium sp.]